MTRVKICGITNIADAQAAVEAGADALGLVFAPSPRRIDVETARGIVIALSPSVVFAGVFRDAFRDDVRKTVTRVGLDCVQLHGNESPDSVAAIHRCTIKSFAVAETDTPANLEARMQSYRVFAFLLDPGAGDGRTFSWEQAIGLNRRIIVAGGLTPENVAEPIRLLRPFAVDVASGVESSPGRKDHEKIRAFIRAVREADAGRIA